MTSDPSAELKTKVELGDDYGMKARSGMVRNVCSRLPNWKSGCVGKNGR